MNDTRGQERTGGEYVRYSIFVSIIPHHCLVFFLLRYLCQKGVTSILVLTWRTLCIGWRACACGVGGDARSLVTQRHWQDAAGTQATPSPPPPPAAPAAAAAAVQHPAAVDAVLHRHAARSDAAADLVQRQARPGRSMDRSRPGDTRCAAEYTCWIRR